MANATISTNAFYHFPLSEPAQDPLSSVIAMIPEQIDGPVLDREQTGWRFLHMGLIDKKPVHQTVAMRYRPLLFKTMASAAIWSAPLSLALKRGVSWSKSDE